MPSHALISGGSSGIGLALAHRLAAQGWNISILARDAARLSHAQSSIEAARAAQTQTIRSFSADVTDADAAAGAVTDAIAALGPPRLLVTSAGIVIPGMFETLPAGAFERTMAVNYFGTLNVVRAALPAMQSARAGRIVLISSGAGLVGLYGYTAYAPSKFAVRGFAESLRAELKPDGIGVSVVYPPDTDTPQLQEEQALRPAALAALAAGSRVLTADAVAGAILGGVARKRFIIAPGRDMKALAVLHSLIAPLLNRLWADRVVKRLHRRSDPKA